MTQPIYLPVLTLRQAAALLQLCERTVRELAAAGELPGHRVGQRWRFLRAELLEWLATRGRTA